MEGNKNKTLEEKGEAREQKGQLGDSIEEKRNLPFQFAAGVGEETPRKRGRLDEGDVGEGTERFTFGVGSIVDTIELRDYTCTLGRRAREHSDELFRLILAMKTEKASMTKVREEAFKKVRTNLMGVVDELVYAQMMMQGRLIEARHQRPYEMISKGFGRRASELEVPLTAGTSTGQDLFGSGVDKILLELNAEKEENRVVETKKTKKASKKRKRKENPDKREEKGEVKEGPPKNTKPAPKAGPSKEVSKAPKQPETAVKQKKAKGTAKTQPEGQAKAGKPVVKAVGPKPEPKPMTVRDGAKE